MQTYIVAGIASCLLTIGVAASAADKGGASTKPATEHGWTDLAKWPDLQGGMWLPVRGPRGSAEPAPVYVPTVAAKVAAMGPIDPGSLGNANCEPLDGPFERIREFFYSKDVIFIMADEDYLSVRFIYMDGRKHGDPDPSYYGHSVGHWENDTLVVDTIGFLPQVTLAPRVPNEGAMQAVERFRLIGKDRLQYQITLTDPKVLAAPFTRTITYTLDRQSHVQEAECSQNNRNRDVDGKEHVDLTPPE
ncbi:MAG: hypothetical protein QM808_03935 [Steroidobacteraceae bacterium]